MRNRSLFGKIFKVNIITIIIGLIISALLQYVFISRLIDDELKSSLRESAEITGNIIAEMGGAQLYTTDRMRDPIFRVRLRQPELDVIVISSEGQIVMSPFPIEPGVIPHEYYFEILRLDSGDDIFISNLGVFDRRMLIHRQPVMLDVETPGIIFVASPTLPGTGHRVFFNVFFFPMLLVTLISLIFSYILSRKITRPIKEISYAAKAFSKGEFKERVNVVGRDEISELSATFNQMADSLEKIENLRRTFVANVSHELRTPMTTIIGFIDGILDGTIPSDAQSEYLAIVLSESRRLSRLISDLLDIARMEDDEFSLDITEFDISEMIRQCVIGFELRIDEQNIALNVEIPDDVCNVRADRDGMWQVLTNLIDNAIKFTHQNLAVDVKLVKIGNNIKISIRNEGSGIAPEELAHIFERFYKTDKSRGVNREGTGLGLFIVKNILHMHGQNVTVNSVVGEFAEFTFSLPSAV